MSEADFIRCGYDIRALTLGSLVADKAAEHGDKPYLHDLPGDRRFSYSDAHSLSSRLAQGLSRLGIGVGQHVALMMDNSPELLWLYFALAKLGAVAVPLNTAARGQLLGDCIARSDAVALIADHGLLDRIGEIRNDLASIAHIIAVGDGDDIATATYADLLNSPDEAPADVARFTDLAQIFYTSGTTGPSKGVMFSHARLMHWCLSIPEHFGYDANDTIYICLPLFHMNGLGSCVMAMLMGAKIALTRRFSASRFWEDIRRSDATVFNLLGSMAPILWSQPASPADRDHRGRICQITPAPAFAADFEARFGLRMVTGFGLTDFGLATAFLPDDARTKMGSAGRPRRGIALRIADEDDYDLPAETIGEILLRTENPWEGPIGYFGMPEESLAAIRNGWFHTGDRGYLDADGYLHFVDRKKDAIRRRGENISSWEIEQICLRHPAIADAAVYGLRSDMSEDEVAISIIRRTGKDAPPPLTEVDFIAFCQGEMAYFMVPRFVSFTDVFPRTLTEKIEKYKLQASAQADLSALWDRERAGIVLRR